MAGQLRRKGISLGGGLSHAGRFLSKTTCRTECDADEVERLPPFLTICLRGPLATGGGQERAALGAFIRVALLIFFAISPVRRLPGYQLVLLEDHEEDREISRDIVTECLPAGFQREEALPLLPSFQLNYGICQHSSRGCG